MQSYAAVLSTMMPSASHNAAGVIMPRALTRRVPPRPAAIRP